MKTGNAARPATSVLADVRAVGELGESQMRKKKRIFEIGEKLPRKAFLGVSIATFLTLAILWWVVCESGLVPPIFLPSPDSVASRMTSLAADGTLWDDTKVSVYRIVTAFVLASVMAIPAGVMLGTYNVWRAMFEPLVDFIRYMPVVAFVPLTILWAGTGDIQKFLIIWIGTFFQQVLMVMDAVKRVPGDFVGLGRTLGLPGRKIIWRIVLPAALPEIWDTLRISLGWAWTWLVVAELVAATSGLGYRIVVSQRYFQTDAIIGYILLLGLFGLVTDQIMKNLEKVLFRYKERSK